MVIGKAELGLDQLIVYRLVKPRASLMAMRAVHCGPVNSPCKQVRVVENTRWGCSEWENSSRPGTGLHTHYRAQRARLGPPRTRIHTECQHCDNKMSPQMSKRTLGPTACREPLLMAKVAPASPPSLASFCLLCIASSFNSPFPFLHQPSPMASFLVQQRHPPGLPASGRSQGALPAPQYKAWSLSATVLREAPHNGA